MKGSGKRRFALIFPVLLCTMLAGGATHVVQDQCGPFSDVPPTLCSYVFELYALGVTAGTSPTTFSPDDPPTRGQGAVLITKGLNQVLARSSRRAALGQWWTGTPQFGTGLGVTPVGPSPFFCGSDGADIWVGSAVPESSGIVTRVRASDGKLLGSWVDAIGAQGVLSAMGRIFVVGTSPSGYNLYMIDPTQPPGPVTLLASNLGPDPSGIAFDGSRIWTANLGSVSIVTPGATLPWPVTTVGGFGTMVGALYDGTDVWVTDYSAGNLLRLDSNGAVQQTVAVGQRPEVAVFDGANIWVPNFLSDTVSVVQASTGTVLATLAVPPGSRPTTAAFDGQRVLVTHYGSSAVSLWNAADLTPLGTFSTGADTRPIGACSDGLNFWMVLNGTSQLARF